MELCKKVGIYFLLFNILTPPISLVDRHKHSEFTLPTMSRATNLSVCLYVESDDRCFSLKCVRFLVSVHNELMQLIAHPITEIRIGFFISLNIIETDQCKGENAVIITRHELIPGDKVLFFKTDTWPSLNGDQEVIDTKDGEFTIGSKIARVGTS